MRTRALHDASQKRKRTLPKSGGAATIGSVTADRPYRPAMPVSKALAIMSDMAGSAIDPVCLAALRRAVELLDRHAA